MTKQTVAHSILIFCSSLGFPFDEDKLEINQKDTWKLICKNQLDIDFQFKTAILVPSSFSAQIISCIQFRYRLGTIKTWPQENGWKEHWMVCLNSIFAQYFLKPKNVPPFCCFRSSHCEDFDLLIKNQRCALCDIGIPYRWFAGA